MHRTGLLKWLNRVRSPTLWRPFPLSPSEQPKGSELASTCHVDFAIDHGRNREANGNPEMIACAGLIAVIELLGNVGCIVGMQHVGPPCFNGPQNSITGPTGGDTHIPSRVTVHG